MVKKFKKGDLVKVLQSVSNYGSPISFGSICRFLGEMKPSPTSSAYGRDYEYAVETTDQSHVYHVISIELIESLKDESLPVKEFKPEGYSLKTQQFATFSFDDIVHLVIKKIEEDGFKHNGSVTLKEEEVGFSIRFEVEENKEGDKDDIDDIPFE